MRSPPIPLTVAERAHQAAAPEPLEPLAKVVRNGIENRRPEAIAQRKLAEFVQNSPRVVAQAKREAALRGEPVQRTGPEEEELRQGKLAPVQRTGPEEEELLQGKFAPVQRAEPEPDREPRENKTGLPDNLKSGIESLSGISMDNVKVHYNSAQPAQLNALAYAQGSDIHVAPGQEQHLPHEAWHVVQQAQGRVKPTMQMKDGVPVNDDVRLEQEADVMGAKALQMTRGQQVAPRSDNVIQLQVALSVMQDDFFTAYQNRMGLAPMDLHHEMDPAWWNAYRALEMGLHQVQQQEVAFDSAPVQDAHTRLLNLGLVPPVVLNQLGRLRQSARNVIAHAQVRLSAYNASLQLNRGAWAGSDNVGDRPGNYVQTAANVVLRLRNTGVENTAGWWAMQSDTAPSGWALHHRAAVAARLDFIYHL